jgi:hypothetical protein
MCGTWTVCSRYGPPGKGGLVGRGHIGRGVRHDGPPAVVTQGEADPER